MFGAYPLRLPSAQLAEMRARAEEAVFEATTTSTGEPAAPLVLSNRPIRVLDQFGFNRADLGTEHLRWIDDVVCHILAARRKGGPVRRVLIVGHTDRVGRPEQNQRLGRRRAAAVLRRLQRRLEQLAPGITKNMRFRASSAGATRPLATNRTALGRGQNRRVEIYIEVERRPRPPVAPAIDDIDLFAPRPPRPPGPRVVFVPGVMGS